MCDSLCAFQPDRTLFAKSSDRPPREPQLIEAHRPRTGSPTLRTQYLSIPDAGGAAIIGARPDWLWGFEHGVNEHRVAVGNEQLWTVDDPSRSPEAFTGMDLVRLALERGRSAEEALDVVTSLLAAHGQGGIGDRDAGKAYYSSFLFGDPHGAWILESSDRSWAARRVDPDEGGVALSNRISLSTDWTRASGDVVDAGDFDRWRRASSPTAHADKRLAVTSAGARAVATGNDASAGARDLVSVLRDHAGESWGRPGSAPEPVAALPPAVIDRLGTGVSLCLHLSDVQATTSSMIASLPRQADEPLRAWFAPGNPCVTVFVPTFGLDGVAPELGAVSTWHRFETLRDRVEQARADDPDDGGRETLVAVRAVLGPVEAELWDEADALVERSPDEQVAWAVDLWPRVDAALTELRVCSPPLHDHASIGEDGGMLDHLSIQCADVDASVRFYDVVLAPLGGVRVMDFGEVVGYGVPPMPDFWLGPRSTGEGFRESHIAFAAPDRAAVGAFFDAAVSSGAEVLHEPRVWPEYHPNYYGAFVRDPDGNNVEAVCHSPE